MTTENSTNMRRPEGRPLKLLTVTQAAELKGVTTHAVRWAIRNGKLASQKIGNGYVLRPADVEAWTPNPNWGAGKNKERESDGTPQDQSDEK